MSDMKEAPDFIADDAEIRRCRHDEGEVILTALRKAIDAGDRSGPAEPFSFDTYIVGKRRGAGA